MSTVSKAKGTLYIRNKSGTITKTYNGSKSVDVSATDFGESYTGGGAIQINETDTSNIITISLDKAAQDEGKTVQTSTIGDIIAFLGGTPTPPPNT